MDLLLEKIFENKSPSEISTMLINLKKFNLKTNNKKLKMDMRLEGE